MTTHRDDNPDAPPTPEEIADAEALRDALGDPSHAHPSADFARALALSHAPRELSPKAHKAIVEKSIARGEVRRAGVAAKRSRVAYLAAGALAIAAAIALVVGRASFAPSASEDASFARVAEPLTPARSTQSLFREPFAKAGGESARIDRIASARASDLRDNRFAAWGVR